MGHATACASQLDAKPYRHTYDLEDILCTNHNAPVPLQEELILLFQIQSRRQVRRETFEGVWIPLQQGFCQIIAILHRRCSFVTLLTSSLVR